MEQNTGWKKIEKGGTEMKELGLCPKQEINI